MQFEQDKYQRTLKDTFEKNKEIRASMVSLISQLDSGISEHYVGCVCCKDKSGREVVVCINNSERKTLFYYPDAKEVEYVGDFEASFSYTGGCYYEGDGCVYGFPRNSNKLLKINIENKTTEEIDIGLDALEDISGKPVYSGHHYDGVLVRDKIICPPRVSKYALVIDLKTYSHRKIKSEIFETNQYNASVLHPNGKVYFMPLKGSSIAEFDPQTDNVRLIGGHAVASLFGGTVYSDGCIYTFSQIEGGLFKVDVSNGTCELVMNKVANIPVGWSYGAITHFNGKIYNIPGGSKYFFEYDPLTQKMNVISTFDDGRFNSAKWAGGALLSNGNIFLVPCKGRFAAEIVFNKRPDISEDMDNLIHTEHFRPI